MVEEVDERLHGIGRCNFVLVLAVVARKMRQDAGRLGLGLGALAREHLQRRQNAARHHNLVLDIQVAACEIGESCGSMDLSLNVHAIEQCKQQWNSAFF